MKTRATALLAVALLALSACADDPGAAASAAGAGPGTGDAGTGSTVAPTLKPGVDPTIFLPHVLVAGYHPTAEEIATSGRACATDGDCATSAGRVVFHCSTPYYGSAQCQGAFPPGDQVVPGVLPSCAYYDCPSAYQCETEAETHSVACLLGQQHHGGRDAGP